MLPFVCCEAEENCCDKVKYTLRIFRITSEGRHFVAHKEYLFPTSFTEYLPSSLFVECGTYEFISELDVCGRKTIKTLTRRIGDREPNFIIVPTTHNCCECVSYGSSITFAVSGNFPERYSTKRSVLWTCKVDGEIIKSMGPVNNMDALFSVDVNKYGTYTIEAEYKDACGKKYLESISFDVVSPIKFSKISCNEYILVNNCTNSEFKRRYVVSKYENGSEKYIYWVDENQSQKLKLGPGVYKVSYDKKYGRYDEFVFFNICALEECMERMLDIYLCENKCTDLRKEIDYYYHQISFLWNYLFRIGKDLNDILHVYCIDKEESYKLLADIIEKLNSLCNVCLKENRIKDCGCGNTKTASSRTIKQ